MPYSLSYFKFQKSLEKEIRNYWSTSITVEFSKEWLSQYDTSKTITKIGTNSPPYSYVDISSSEFIQNFPTLIEHARENALVNFITAFEVYLFDSLCRILFLDPSVVDDSGMKFEAKELVQGVQNKNFKKWFAFSYTDKIIRGKQHDEVIRKIGKMCKCDLTPILSKIEEWNRWTYVRNSIVHTGRSVSGDLNRELPVRFPSIGSKLILTNQELMWVQTLSMKIAKHLDNRINQTIIGSHDAALLTRELFIRHGIHDEKHIKRILNSNLDYKAKRVEIEKAISNQRKHPADITEYDFDGIINDVII